MAGEEARGVRFSAVKPLLEQLVELADHGPVGRQGLRRHVADLVGQPLQVRVEHLSAQLLEERMELGARLGLQEVVALERADPVPQALGHGRQLIAPPAGQLAQHAAQLRRARLAGGLRHAAVDAPPLGLDDVLQALPELRHDVAEPVALEGLAAFRGHALQQVAQAGQAAVVPLGRPAHAAFQEPAERRADRSPSASRSSRMAASASSASSSSSRCVPSQRE